jgi:hypothetical protein
VCVCARARARSRDSSVGIALGYGLDDRGSRVRFPAGDGNFSLHHRVQTSSGAHPASYPVGTGAVSLRVKLTTPLHLVPRSRVRGAIRPFPQYVFMVWCLVKHRDNFTFTFTFTFWVCVTLRLNIHHSVAPNITIIRQQI